MVGIFVKRRKIKFLRVAADVDGTRIVENRDRANLMGDVFARHKCLTRKLLNTCGFDLIQILVAES